MDFYLEEFAGKDDTMRSALLAWPADLAAFERKAAVKDLRKNCELAQEKKQYVRPQLQTHGCVEQQTQQSDGGPSVPIVFSAKHKK